MRALTVSSKLLSKSGLFIGVPILVAAVTAAPPPPGGPPAGPPNPPPTLGQPLRGLPPGDLATFSDGRTEFTNVEKASDGLGPVFNGVSCAQCHSAGAIGGAATNIGLARVTRIGAMHAGIYTDLVEFGGPVLQARSLREFNPAYPVRGEIVPPQAQFVSRRITTPLFGDGLVEAIPDETILSRTRNPQPDGVHGIANYDTNPITGNPEVGRFGWKAQHAKLLSFAGDAYLNEMGITNSLFPTENLPQGLPIPPGADAVPDPEDEADDIVQLAAFMRFLAPPARKPLTLQITRGQQVFNSMQCQACHTPMMNTGFNLNPALSNRPVELWSDLLVHRMGPALADGIQQGKAMGDQWRTAPLWGLSARRFYLHDGRATNIDQAVRLHGGEAAPSTLRYTRLTATDRAAVVAFLGSL